MNNGEVHAVLGVSLNQSPFPAQGCELLVTTKATPTSTPQTATWVITGNGTGSLVSGALPVVAAPRILTAHTIQCMAGAAVTIDWLSLQNTDHVVPPSSEVEVSWEDVGMPGGGFFTGVVRTGDGSTLYAGSDVGGIARNRTALPDHWRTISGNPLGGALVSQPDMGVWEILPASWGELFIVTGRYTGGQVYGGLFNSWDDGDSWQPLVDSEPEPDNNDALETTIGAYRRYDACGGNQEWTGGTLLAEEPGNEGVYIANHDTQDLGLAFWDGSQACMVATGDLPSAVIASITKVESSPSALQALLVGYRGLGGSNDALYLCSLPLDAADADGDLIVDEVYFDCGDVGGVTCVSMPEGQGTDIRDFQVDTIDPSVVYVADGGNDPELATCESGVGAIYQFQLTDDGLGTLDWVWDGAISTGMPLDADLELTGVSMDPDGDFLYAFVPSSPAGGYAADRIYRIAWAEIGTAGWVPINEDGGSPPTDEADRAAALDLSGGWLDATTATVVRPRVSTEGTAATYSPGYAVDAVWFADATTGADLCGGEDYAAAITTSFNMWRVDGLDGGCDGSAWDPEDDTSWTFWPEPDQLDGQAWQDTVVVGFQGYTASTYAITQTGRLGLTTDGGITWLKAEFGGDWAATPGDATDDCSEATFFTQVNGVALLQQADRTYNSGGTDWRLELFASSRLTDPTPSDTSDDWNFQECALARVVITPDDPLDADSDPEAAWTWYPLDRDDTVWPVG